MSFPRQSPLPAFWTSSPYDLRNHRTTPTLPPKADIVIIGSGYTGAATAFFLLQDSTLNLSTVILEARDACSGATGRNGGHVKPDPYLNVPRWVEMHGRETATFLSISMASTHLKHYKGSSSRRYTRSRRGCNKCRQSKLKCDEARPSCEQCLKRGVHCPGYQQEFRWSHKHEVFRPDNADGVTSQDSKSNTDTRVGLDSGFEPELSQAQQTVPSTRAQWDLDRSGGALPGPKYHPRDAGVQTSPEVLDWDDFNSNDNLGDAEDHRSTPHPTISSGQTPFEIHQDPEALLDFYFNKICDLHATFDDPTAPFRSIVGERLESSTMIFNCVVSMCATHLFQDDKAMLPVCLNYHSTAVLSLSETITTLDAKMSSIDYSIGLSPSSRLTLEDHLKEALLASILLGTSSLDPSDLGIPHLLGARKLTEYWIRTLDLGSYHTSPSEAMSDPEVSFFIGAMAYWEAVVAFVIDQPFNAIDYLSAFMQPEDGIKIIPNPYTGVSTPIIILLARVGICLRQKRMLSHMKSLGWGNGDVYVALRAQILEFAAGLEEMAMGYEIPEASNLVQGVNDIQRDFLDQMLCFGQMYKLAILLELYRAFPELIPDSSNELSQDYPSDASTQAALNMAQSANFTGSLTVSVDQMKEQERRVHHLGRSMVCLIEDIPLQHKSSMHQTLALIICASVLYAPPPAIRTPKQKNSVYPSKTDAFNQQMETIEMRRKAVERRRAVVRSRMTTNSTCFGLSRLFQRAEALVEAVWDGLDHPTTSDRGFVGSAASNSLPGVHWIDIMLERSLQSFFG